MAVPLADAIVVCSCGRRWGRVSRAAACEEMEAVEHALIAAEVPMLIRHHELGHRVGLGENAPRSFLAVVAEVARRVAVARGAGAAVSLAGLPRPSPWWRGGQMSLGSRTALNIVDGARDYEGRRARIYSAKAYVDSMLEDLAELVFAAAMKGATPNQLKETVLSQMAMPELRMHPRPQPSGETKGGTDGK